MTYAGATLGANPKRITMECGSCGARAAALIPSGFACLGCALEAFYEAAEAGDNSWYPVLLRSPRNRHRRFPVPIS
jgi:hypothetical protein